MEGAENSEDTEAQRRRAGGLPQTTTGLGGDWKRKGQGEAHRSCCTSP